MRTIKHIVILKNNSCIINFVSHEEIVLHFDIVLQYSLSKNLKIDDLTYKEIIDKQNLLIAKQKGFNYASYKPRSEFEIKKKLLDLKFDDSIINQVIDFLQSFNLIDDIKFTNNYILTKSKLKSYGKNKIINLLILKGISKDLSIPIYDTLINESDTLELIKKAIEKKMKILSNSKKNQQQIKASLFNYLVARGFEFNSIKKAINEVNKF